MFKNNTDSKMSKNNDLSSPERLNRIVEGTTIEGSINSESNIRIDGFVKGTITTKGRLVVGVTGIISGDIICQNAEIEGKVNGSMNVEELLSLKSTAKVEGDIKTGKLSIEPGAIFAVTCSMGGVNAANTQNNKVKEREKVIA